MRIEKWIEANESRIDSHELFEEWVEMHSTHNYWREEQASIITRIMESIQVEHSTIIDLVCGAGGLSEFLLKSSRNMNIIGVDSNPFLLMIYKNHLAEYRDRFSLIKADIRKEDTIKGAGKFNAAVSFTSFHNFSRQTILKVFRYIYESLPGGGIFATGDVTSLSNAWLEGLHLSAKSRKPVITMDNFWQKVKTRYNIAEEIDEMNALTAIRDTPEHGYPPTFYVNGLRWAGFEIADVAFQAGNRIVYCGKKA
jgi:cyclopropane fatty-acyl-phospholipid synthase-like methyltransferase